MDIALRATFAFFFIFLITRVVGRRELGSLEPFDLILLIVLGDLVQQGITQSDYSVTGLVVAVTTMALLTVLVSYLSYRFPRLRPVLEGEPVVIIHDGRPVERNLERERLTLGEVMAEARATADRIAGRDQVGCPRDERSDQLHQEVRLTRFSCRVMWRAERRLRFRRATLAKVDRKDRHRADREELRLPVLQAAIPEVGVGPVLAPADRRGEW